MKRTIFLAALLLFVFACEKKSNQPIVQVVEGVELVHNPATPLYPDRTVKFILELTIGENKSEKAILYKPSGFTVDAKDNIYVADRDDMTIKVFDKNGNFIRAIGRKGGGPGEFEGLGEIAVLPNGKLLALDWRNRRTTLFTPDGKFLSSFQWKTRGYQLFLYTDSSFTRNENIFGKKRQLFVKTFDLDGNEMINFGEFTRIGVKLLRKGGMAFAITLPYSPHSIFAGDNQQQWLYHCLNNQYLIEVYDHTGKLFRKIDRPYTPLPFTDKDKQDYIDYFASGKKPFLEMAKDVEFPQIKTVASKMIVDDQGNLWVRTNEETEKAGKTLFGYDIFDHKGFYTSRVWTSISPDQFVRGKMYRIHTDDETGMITVERYKVIWQN